MMSIYNSIILLNWIECYECWKVSWKYAPDKD